MTVLEIRDLRKAFGGVRALAGVTMTLNGSVTPGEAPAEWLMETTSPGNLVRVDIDPNSDSMRFEQVEQTAAQEAAAKSEPAAPAASAAKSGKRR